MRDAHLRVMSRQGVRGIEIAAGDQRLVEARIVLVRCHASSVHFSQIHPQLGDVGRAWRVEHHGFRCALEQPEVSVAGQAQALRRLCIAEQSVVTSFDPGGALGRGR